MAHQVFYVVLQVNFLSSLPHVEGSTVANSIADDVADLLLASSHSDDIWSSLQLLEEKSTANPLHHTSEDPRIKRQMISER